MVPRFANGYKARQTAAIERSCQALFATYNPCREVVLAIVAGWKRS
jgi:hypothetical protein